MFEHSVKVPRLYKTAGTVLKRTKNGESMKQVLYEQKHPNLKGILSLASNAFGHSADLEKLFNSIKALQDSRGDHWLLKILITELLWGKKTLSGNSRPIVMIRELQPELEKHFSENPTLLPDHHANSQVSVSRPRYARVNTLRITMDEAVEKFCDEGWTLVPHDEKFDYKGFLDKVAELGQFDFMIDIHVKNLLVFPPKTEFHKHEAYRNNLIVLQDKASCLPVELLNPTPGSAVLDMCAAPGMKTTQIACCMNNEGTIFAVERDLKRLRVLDNIVESYGATCVTTLGRDVLQVEGEDYKDVEYVLVDPSCSGSGIQNRLETKPNAENRIRLLTGFQKRVLRHALTSFPGAKRVVYSTCSLNPQENEGVVQEIIVQTKNFKLVNAFEKLEGLDWLTFGNEQQYGKIGKSCLYARPEVDLTNGFFVAIFERLAEGDINPFFDESRVVAIRPFVNNLKSKEKKLMRNKRKHKDHKSDVDDTKPIESVVMNDENGDQVPTKPKKSKASVCHDDYNLEDYNEVFESDTSVNKSKGKNKKKVVQIEKDPNVAKEVDDDAAIMKVPKKRKKKSAIPSNDSVSSLNENLDMQEQHTGKKKKKATI